MHDPVITPEAVALDLEPATVGSRSVAIVLDYLLMAAGLLLLGAAEAAFGFGGFVPDWLGVALVLLLAFGLQFGYPVGFETLMRGRTPGKAAMGLRVVTTEGAPVRFRHAAARAAVGLLELVGTLGAIAVIASFASPRGQRLGDLAAGTLVVRERRSGAAPEALRFDPPRGLESYVRILDVSGLGPSDYATIREVLRRPLDPATRESVARRVADGLVERVQPAPPGGIDAVTWLRCVASAVQARAGDGQSGGAPGDGPSGRAPGADPSVRAPGADPSVRAPGADPSGAVAARRPRTAAGETVAGPQEAPRPAPAAVPAARRGLPSARVTAATRRRRIPLSLSRSICLSTNR